MSTKNDQLVKECSRQEESCKYTSTTFYIWLRRVRIYNRIFVIAPIVFSSFSTWKILVNDSPVWVPALFALLAGLVPAIYKALDLPTNVKSIAIQAAEFKNLQDRFRQAGQVLALGEETAFAKQFELLMKRLEEARKFSTTPPEWCFKKAQKKIDSGDYDFAIDQAPKS